MVSGAARLHRLTEGGLRRLLVRVLTYRGTLGFDLICEIVRLEHGVATRPADISRRLNDLVRDGTVERSRGLDGQARWRLAPTKAAHPPTP